jgi:hypothetical protein
MTDGIDIIQDNIRTLEENAIGICESEGLSDVWEKIELIKEHLDEINDYHSIIKDELYLSIFSCTTRKSISIEDICTVRDESVYSYSKTTKLEMIDLATNISTINNQIQQNCKNETKRNKINEVLQLIKDIKGDICMANKIQEDEYVYYSANSVPREFRADINEKEEDTYLIQLSLDKSSTDSMKLSFVNTSSLGKFSMRGKRITVNKDFDKNNLVEIKLLVYHIKEIIDMVYSLEAALKSYLDELDEVISITRDNFSGKLVSQRI